MLDRTLFRYSGAVAALLVMLFWDLKYFEGEFRHLPALLKSPLLALAVITWLLYLYFVVPFLSVASVLSAAWLGLRGHASPWQIAWRVVLGLISFAVWAATIGRFEYPGS
jgi:hypothetical protein